MPKIRSKSYYHGKKTKFPYLKKDKLDLNKEYVLVGRTGNFFIISLEKKSSGKFIRLLLSDINNAIYPTKKLKLVKKHLYWPWDTMNGFINSMTFLGEL